MAAHDPARDLRNLRALAIGHYVVGFIAIVMSLISLIRVEVMKALLADPGFMPLIRKYPGAEGSPVSPEMMQRFLGAFLIGIAIYGILRGLLTIISGHRIASRRNRAFSLVMGAVNCPSLFLGTILGVLTLLILSRDSVRDSYATQVASDA